MLQITKNKDAGETKTQRNTKTRGKREDAGECKDAKGNAKTQGKRKDAGGELANP